MNLGLLFGAMLALVVAMVLACKMARACTDNNCQTWGTVLLAMSRSRSSDQHSSLTKKKTVAEALSELRSKPTDSANGESLLAIRKSVSKVHAAVEDQMGSNPKLDIERNMQQSVHEVGPESFPKHVGTEDVSVATRGRHSPRNMTAQRPFQITASQFRRHLQHARRTGNRTLRAALAQTVHRSSFANNATRSLQVQAANRSHAQSIAPRPTPAAEVPELERGPHSSRGPWLPGLLPPINLAGLASLWHLLRRSSGTSLEPELQVSYLDQQIHMAVEAARQHNSWLLIAAAVAIFLSILFAWQCCFRSPRGRLPGFDIDNLENEVCQHEAWVLHQEPNSGKRSSGSNFIPTLALPPASRSHEKARSPMQEPRSRLF